ncbi:glycosyltransferase family 2 protein [Nocardioides anomalus]|uniref:Glycosyltransferase family 2 protein n=1 Tax=Nocardioides anomalus TaxID=2712223 RepID=A0A6G6WDJ2_9ACTN|nr:glycosyltransferase [Nocardioides anomalus]QIG43312.1 glycosyltransferase family 2 protein [Nocardioides anomalus]
MTGPCAVCLDHDPPPPVAPHVTVAVLHYEQHADLARTLRCLRRQSLAPVQVIVSDDGSAVAPRVPDDVLLLRQPDRGFRAALARNRALAAATGDVVAFLDADTSPEPGYLAALADAVRREPDALAVGRRRYTTFPDDAPDDPLAGAVERSLDEPAWLADGWAAIQEPGAGDDGSFRFVIAATLAGSTAWLRRVGGFDETFSAYGGEDWDLAHRWWLLGGGLRHVADAVAWHHGPHAGEEPRTWDDRLEATDRALGETLGIAARIHAAPAAFRGLRGARTAPPRVVLTHDDALSDRELVVTVDAALAGLPLLGVLTDRRVLLDLGDPRVRTDPALLTSAAVQVHAHRGTMGEAWPALLDGTVRSGADTLRWLDADGQSLVSTSDLRRVRRSHLGLRTAVEATSPLPPGLGAVGEASLAAWLGGWAR